MSCTSECENELDETNLDGICAVNTIKINFKDSNLYHPMGVSWSSKYSSLFIVDYGNHRICRLKHNSKKDKKKNGSFACPLMRQNKHSVVCGSGLPGFREGDGKYAYFNKPTGIVTSLDGHLYVVDHGNHCVRKFTIDGKHVFTIGRPEKQGCLDGFRDEAAFHYPCGIAIEEKFADDIWRGLKLPGSSLPMKENHRIYLADTFNHRICVITSDGEVFTLAGNGTKGYHDERGIYAMFNHPRGLVLDPNEDNDQGPYLYVSDELNHCIRSIQIFTADVYRLAGNTKKGTVNGPLLEAQFDSPGDLCLTHDGDILLVDRKNNGLRLIALDQHGGEVVTLISGKERGTHDGNHLTTTFNDPAGIASSPPNIYYIADCGSSSIRSMYLDVVKLNHPGPNRIRPMVMDQLGEKNTSPHEPSPTRSNEDPINSALNIAPEQDGNESFDTNPVFCNEELIGILQPSNKNTLEENKENMFDKENMYRHILKNISNQVQRFQSLEQKILPESMDLNHFLSPGPSLDRVQVLESPMTSASVQKICDRLDSFEKRLTSLEKTQQAYEKRTTRQIKILAERMAPLEGRRGSDIDRLTAMIVNLQKEVTELKGNSITNT